MKQSVAKVVVWILVGMLLMGGIMWVTMPSLMLVEHKSTLGYEETIAALNESITSKPNWKVLALNDYKKSIQEAGHGDIGHSASINICNPFYASKILANAKDRGVTAFMPLAVGVYEDKAGQVYVSQLNIGLLGMMFGGTIAEVMGMAGQDVKEIIEPVVK